MARAIDGDAVKRRVWDIAEAWKSQGRDYEALLLESVVEQIVDSQPILTPQWISVEESLPKAEQEVLVACKTRISGYRYQCQGFYVPRGMYREDSEFTWDYEACDEYDEERDDYLVNEGWYERIHNWDEYGAVSISDIVTHWMPLPEPPEALHE